MRNWLYILALTCIVGLNSRAQGIMEELSAIFMDENQSDSARVDAAIEIANRIYYRDLDSAEVIVNQAKALSLRSNYKYGLARVDGFIGFIHHHRGDYPLALKFYSNSIQYNLANGFDVERAMDLDNYGTVLSALDDPEAVRYFKQSQEIYEAKNMEYDLVFVYSHLANYYDKNDVIDSALLYFRKANSICKDPRSSISVNLGLSMLYSNIDLLDSSEFYARKLTYVSDITSDSSILARSYELLAGVKYEKGDLDSALYYGNKAFGIYNHLSIMVRDQFYRTMSKVHQGLGNHQTSYAMTDSALHYLDITYSKDLRESAFREAIHLELSLENISDSLMYLAETERQELQHIIELEKESQTRSVLLLGIVCLIVVSIVIFIGYRRSTKKNKIILEQKELVDQKNVEREVLIREIHHRVKNNFQIICSVLRLQSWHVDDEKVAEVFQDAIRRISSMAQVHDMFYKRERFVDASPQEYFENLTRSYRFCQDGREVHYKLNSEVESLSMDSLISLGLISNELITNSLKHAFNNTNVKPTIEMSLVESSEGYEFNFKDNGPGFDHENLKLSFGMELIKTMTEQLNGDSNINSDSGMEFTLIYPN